MPGRSSTSPGAPRERVSYLGLLLNLGSVLCAIGGLYFVVRSGESPPASSAIPKHVPGPSAPRPVAVAAPRPKEPAPPPPPVLDREAVARAERAIEAARLRHARAEARAEEAAHTLAEARLEVSVAASTSRDLEARAREPEARVARASTRGGFLRAERDRVKGEVIGLARAPRPRAKPLVDRSPVATPSEGDEYHFEVRRNRVTFIDLERLLDLVKADARLRIRLSENARVVEAKVGPVGPFSLIYVLSRGLPQGMQEMIERRGLSYDLSGWEVVPDFEGRGETYDATRQPVSNYARAINQLSPSRATITMWVYPDGFPLFRRLRDDLHARGFLVAARPLPEGMAIRGSPAGSLSAGQ